MEVVPTSSDRNFSKIAAEFPGRSQKSLQVSYCVNFKKRAEKFQDDDVQSFSKPRLMVERTSSDNSPRGECRNVEPSGK